MLNKNIITQFNIIQNKLINLLIINGKKKNAFNIYKKSLFIIKKYTKKNPYYILSIGFSNLNYLIEIKNFYKKKKILKIF